MKNVLNEIRLFINRVRFMIPSKLPVGMTEFEKWSSSIVEAYKMPKNDTTKWALAGAILHLESTAKYEMNLLLFKFTSTYSSAYKSKSFFGQYLRKMASNEIAAANLQIIKQKQQEEILAAQNANKSVPIDITPEK